MKVYEIMEMLSKFPAGADIILLTMDNGIGELQVLNVYLQDKFTAIIEHDGYVYSEERLKKSKKK